MYRGYPTDTEIGREEEKKREKLDESVA